MSQPTDLELTPRGRLMSLDFFRGFTMLLLIAEATGIYSLLAAPELADVVNNAATEAGPSRSDKDVPACSAMSSGLA